MTATATKTDPLHALTAYHWEPQPKAAAFVKKVVDDFLAKLPEAKAFAELLYRETGNRFNDLICQVDLPLGNYNAGEIESAGWSKIQSSAAGVSVYEHECGIFPALLLHTSNDIRVGLKVEAVADFMSANRAASGQVYGEAFGRPLDTYRLAVVAQNFSDAELYVVERHGAPLYGSSDLRKTVRSSPEATLETAENFRLRTRANGDEHDDFEEINALVDKAIASVGRDVACDLFFAAEREYWQRRNTAAQFQKARQDKLGIGWANHDHHTYRSSRRHFHKLIALWEKLGFECRERFYPGPEAGWGAQVMEQPVCGIVTFNDVDISEDEMLTDFAHEPMQDRTADNGGLATVGLWCALHGESVLQAGMHHLECTFDFEALREQMEKDGGIATMPKFTDFPHLKQAFTKGERWEVDPQRIDALLDKRLITEHQAKEFRKNGAIGSHLENLERNDGFKGFNQTGVTDIIKRTDPRYAADSGGV